MQTHKENTMSATATKAPVVREGMPTPWGESDTAYAWCDWAGWVSTASHGGCKIDGAHNAMIPAQVREQRGWYEEDCAWAIPFMVFPELCALEAQHHEQDAEKRAARIIKNAEQAKQTVLNWYPDFYEQWTGRKIGPGESFIRDRQTFDRENAHRLVVVSAVGDWAEGVPLGSVLVTATLGGKRDNIERDGRKFLVPAGEYAASRRGTTGFVVDEARHAEFGKVRGTGFAQGGAA